MGRVWGEVERRGCRGRQGWIIWGLVLCDRFTFSPSTIGSYLKFLSWGVTLCNLFYKKTSNYCVEDKPLRDKSGSRETS